MAAKGKKKAKRSVVVTWFGHSAMLFESSAGKRVLIDPWLDNPKAPANSREIADVDLILISHGHGDHIGNTIELARRMNAGVVAIHEVALYLKSKGITAVHGMNKGGTITMGGVVVTMVDAKHSSDIDVESPPIPGGQAAGFVIRFEDGCTVYHAGDTSLFGDMRFIRSLYKPDVACIPIGDLYTMGPREAAMACALLLPKHILGLH
ncbi:MAG: metal-dependent hydrolase [Bacteroidetes bacterium]|nr:metal-dependent hydrolase [Bacteroidota bacterium]